MKFLIICIFLASNFLSVAEINEQNTTNRIVVISVCQHKGKLLVNVNADSANYFFYKAYRLSYKLFSENIHSKVRGYYFIKSLRLLITDYSVRHDNYKVRQFCDTAFKYFEHSKITMFKNELSYILNKMAYVCISNSDLVNGAVYMEKALKIFETQDNKLGISDCKVISGVIKYYQKNYSRAMICFNDAYKLREIECDKNGMAECLIKIAAVHYQLQDFENEKINTNKALKIFEKTGNLLGLAECYNNIGILYSTHGNDLSVLSNFQKSLDIYKRINNNLGISRLSENIGNYYSYNKKIDESFAYYKLAIEAAKNAGDLFQEKGIYLRLYSNYYEKKNYEKALKYYLRFSYVSNKFLDIEKDRIVSELETKYETEKKEGQIQTQKILITHKNSQIRNLFIGISIIILLLVIVLFQYIKKRKAYLQIVKQNLEIVRREKEQRLLYNVSEPTIETKEEKRTISNLPDEQKQILFNAVTEAMEKQEIYKEKDLTIDKLATQLNTNRSYLSQVINDLSGLSFSNYLNKYRINEALRILSDTQKNVPVKLLFNEVGFNSMNAFYESFKKIVGVTPSFYRKNAIKISDNQNYGLTD